MQHNVFIAYIIASVKFYDFALCPSHQQKKHTHPVRSQIFMTLQFYILLSQNYAHIN